MEDGRLKRSVLVVCGEVFLTYSVLPACKFQVSFQLPHIYSDFNIKKSSKMTSENAVLAQAQEAFQMVHQISQLLCTGLDTESLAICIRLCELGVDPQTLAHVIWEIRKMGEQAVQNKPGPTNPSV